MTNAVVMEARNWLGTPFVPGASVCGVGTDCAGLIEGVARKLGFDHPSRQAVQHDILAAASAFLMPTNSAVAGTLVLLAREPGGLPLHAAIVTDTDTLIHAHWSAGVVENHFGGWFQRRVTHAFAWSDGGDLPLPRLCGFDRTRSCPRNGGGVS